MALFSYFPTLETERLMLREMTLEDAPAVYHIFSDADVTKDMGIEPFDSTDRAAELIQFMNELFHQDAAIRWGIIRKSDNLLIGTCGFNSWELQRGARGEIAYDLGKDYWRHGYMTEVLQAVITFGFEKLGFQRIEAYTNIDAMPSMNLLVKLGFKKEGVLRDFAFFHKQYWDQNCFSLLKNEWKCNEDVNC